MAKVWMNDPKDEHFIWAEKNRDALMAMNKTEVSAETWRHAMEYRDALAEVFVPKSDRRSELLELASRIQVSRPNASAQTCVTMAAAIIAEVDRVSGEVKHGQE